MHLKQSCKIQKPQRSKSLEPLGDVSNLQNGTETRLGEPPPLVRNILWVLYRHVRKESVRSMHNPAVLYANFTFKVYNFHQAKATKLTKTNGCKTNCAYACHVYSSCK